MITRDEIVSSIRAITSGDRNARASLADVSNMMLGAPLGRWSNRRYRQYNQISAELQRMKRDGVVKYVGGKGAGWRLV